MQDKWIEFIQQGLFGEALVAPLNEINCVFYKTRSVSSTKPVVSTVCQMNLIHDLVLISITVEY